MYGAAMCSLALAAQPGQSKDMKMKKKWIRFHYQICRTCNPELQNQLSIPLQFEKPWKSPAFSTNEITAATESYR
jgi:hypothetical protein